MNRNYLNQQLPNVPVNSRLLANMRRLVRQVHENPNKPLKFRGDPYELNDEWEERCKRELEEALSKGSYAFVQMLVNFTEIDPGFHFKVHFFRNKFYHKIYVN